MHAFARFMNTIAGRLTRVIAGLLMLLGAFVLGGASGIALAAVGLIPLLAGALDVCLLAPVLHIPWSGRGVRAHYAQLDAAHR